MGTKAGVGTGLSRGRPRSHGEIGPPEAAPSAGSAGTDPAESSAGGIAPRRSRVRVSLAPLLKPPASVGDSSFQTSRVGSQIWIGHHDWASNQRFGFVGSPQVSLLQPAARKMEATSANGRGKLRTHRVRHEANTPMAVAVESPAGTPIRPRAIPLCVSDVPPATIPTPRSIAPALYRSAGPRARDQVGDELRRLSRSTNSC
jgi:hypothetical protein